MKKDYKQVAKEIGEVVEKKNKAYGNSVVSATKIIKIYLEKYSNNDGTYTIPEELIDVIVRQTRIMDKQSRLFNNPKMDLMKENPYKDITGYGLLGHIQEELEKEG